MFRISRSCGPHSRLPFRRRSSTDSLKKTLSEPAGSIPWPNVSYNCRSQAVSVARKPAVAKRVTTGDFIQRGRAAHGNRYDYSRAEYQCVRNSVTIVCPEHGQFQKMPANDYQGKECGDCLSCGWIVRASMQVGTLLAQMLIWLCDRSKGDLVCDR